MANIRISQQLSQGYNPDGTPGTISTGALGPGPTDDQVSVAVESYLTSHPASIQVMNEAMNQDPVMLGPGSGGANDVMVTVATNGTKDAYIQAMNGADPMNMTGRQPINLYVLPETGGALYLGGTVNIAQMGLAYGAGGSFISAPDKITLSVPNVTATGSLSTLGNFGMAQQPDPGGLGGFNTLWPRSDGGWYSRSGAASVTRLPVHWGTGTSFPSTGRITGDLYVHTGLACTMRFNGTSWVQTEDAMVSSSTARTAISTSYSALLYQGFRVVQTDMALVWVWNGSAWALLRAMGSPPLMGFAVSGLTTTTSLSPFNGYTKIDNSGGLISLSTGGVFTFNATGKVSMEATVYSDSSTTRWVWAQAVLPSTQSVSASAIDDFRVAPAGFTSGGTTRQILSATWSVTAGDTTQINIASSVASTCAAQGNVAYI